MRALKKAEAAKQKPKTPTKAETEAAARRALQQSAADAWDEMRRQKGEIDRLEARIVALEAKLRELAEATESNAAKHTALRQAFEQAKRPVATKPAAQSIAVPLVVDEDDVSLPGGR